MNQALPTTRDERIAQRCAADGLAGLLATRWPNFARTSNYLRTLPFATGSAVAALVDGGTGVLAALVLPRIEAASLTDYDLGDVIVVLYGSFHFDFSAAEHRTGKDGRLSDVLDGALHETSFASALARALGESGLSGEPVGCDDLNVVADAPGLGLCDARAAWKWIRRVKTDSEIELLRRSAQITETIERELLQMCTVGVSAADLRSTYERRSAELGGIPGFWSTGAGPHAPMILDSAPRPLIDGDLVRFDFGCTYRGYWSDTGRTASLGSPSEAVMKAQRALLAGVEAGFDALAPGIAPSALFRRIMDAIHDSGLPDYARHHVGHSIGADMYDADFIAPGEDEPIEVGMVLNLEVPLYRIGALALQIEDTAVVTDTGYELFTTNTRDITVNGI